MHLSFGATDLGGDLGILSCQRMKRLCMIHTGRNDAFLLGHISYLL